MRNVARDVRAASAPVRFYFFISNIFYKGNPIISQAEIGREETGCQVLTNTSKREKKVVIWGISVYPTAKSCNSCLKEMKSRGQTADAVRHVGCSLTNISQIPLYPCGMDHNKPTQIWLEVQTGIEKHHSYFDQGIPLESPHNPSSTMFSSLSGDRILQRQRLVYLITLSVCSWGISTFFEHVSGTLFIVLISNLCFLLKSCPLPWRRYCPMYTYITSSRSQHLYISAGRWPGPTPEWVPECVFGSTQQSVRWRPSHPGSCVLYPDWT